MIINETTGNVEIKIRDWVMFVARMNELIDRMDELLSERDDVRPEAVLHENAGAMTMDEFRAFSREWLSERNKRCAVFRFAGRWSHVNDKGVIVGAWQTIDEAIDATSCDNDCSPAMFKFD